MDDQSEDTSTDLSATTRDDKWSRYSSPWAKRVRSTHAAYIADKFIERDGKLIHLIGDIESPALMSEESLWMRTKDLESSLVQETVDAFFNEVGIGDPTEKEAVRMFCEWSKSRILKMRDERDKKIIDESFEASHAEVTDVGE